MSEIRFEHGNPQDGMPLLIKLSLHGACLQLGVGEWSMEDHLNIADLREEEPFAKQ